jgi:hypothetical protein
MNIVDRLLQRKDEIKELASLREDKKILQGLILKERREKEYLEDRLKKLNAQTRNAEYEDEIKRLTGIINDYRLKETLGREVIKNRALVILEELMSTEARNGIKRLDSYEAYTILKDKIDSDYSLNYVKNHYKAVIDVFNKIKYELAPEMGLAITMAKKFGKKIWALTYEPQRDYALIPKAKIKKIKKPVKHMDTKWHDNCIRDLQFDPELDKRYSYNDLMKKYCLG